MLLSATTITQSLVVSVQALCDVYILNATAGRVQINLPQTGVVVGTMLIFIRKDGATDNRAVVSCGTGGKIMGKFSRGGSHVGTKIQLYRRGARVWLANSGIQKEWLIVSDESVAKE